MGSRTKIFLSVGIGAFILAALSFNLRKSSPAAPGAPITHDNIGYPGNHVPRIGRPAGFRSTANDSAGHFREWLENPDQIPVLTPEQLDDYLAANHRNAASLLGAFRTTRDPQFLREAEQNFPNDPRVDFAAAFADGISPEERHDWVEKLKQNDPNNPMGNYLAARDDLQNGQSAQALQEMNAAAGKSVPQNYVKDFVQNAQEAYLAAGYSEIDAKTAASENALAPELIQFKQLAKGLAQLAETAQTSGDSASSQAALQMTMKLGGQLDNDENPNLITSLVGKAIEYIALNQMDPNAPYGSGDQTVQNQLDRLKQEKTDFRNLLSQVQPVIPTLSDSDMETYLGRRQLFGELPAMQWVAGKYGSGVASSH